MQIRTLRLMVAVEALFVGALVAAFAATPAQATDACANKKCRAELCAGGLDCTAQSQKYCTCAEVGCITYECAGT